jgi:hypothetical protein
MAKMLIGGQEIQLTDSEFRRMKTKASRHEFGLELLQSGAIVNLNLVTAILPEGRDITQMEIVGQDASEAFGFAETFGQMPVDDGTDTTDGRLTGEQVAAIIEKSGLNQVAFAATVGYSPATVRMAVKEGRVSKEFSAAVMMKYSSMVEPEVGAEG